MRAQADLQIEGWPLGGVDHAMRQRLAQRDELLFRGQRVLGNSVVRHFGHNALLLIAYHGPQHVVARDQGVPYPLQPADI